MNYIVKIFLTSVVNGVMSDLKFVEYGTPQISDLGPLLFDVYVNDLCCSMLPYKIASRYNNFRT